LCEHAENVKSDEGLSPDCLVHPLVSIAYTCEVFAVVENGTAKDLHDDVVDGDEDLEPEVPFHHAVKYFLQLLSCHFLSLVVFLIMEGVAKDLFSSRMGFYD